MLQEAPSAKAAGGKWRRRGLLQLTVGIMLELQTAADPYSAT